MAKTLLTKVIALLLIMAMMLSLAVACGESETTTKKPVSTTPVEDTDEPEDEITEPAETTAAPKQELAYPAQLEGVKDDLEDNTVQFVYVEGEEGFYTAKSLWVDEETAAEIDPVDQQTIDRNNRIEEDLGITIEAFTDNTLSISGLYTFAKTYFDVQDPGIDVYCGFQYYDLKVALTGNILNLNTIVNENNETFIDIT